jgi:hypothetical protein
MGILIAYLMGILTAIKAEDHHRGNKSQPSYRSEQQAFPNLPLSVVCIPPTLNEHEKAQRKKKDRNETISFWVGIGTLVILGIYAFFTILIWCAMKDQVAEMQALHPQPFVAIDGNKLAGDLTFTGGYPMLNVSYSVKNYGTAIAINETDYAVVLSSDDLQKTWKLFKQWCWTGEPTVDVSKLTPEESEMVTSFGQTMMPPGMIIEGRQGEHNPIALVTSANQHKIVFLVIEVCIEYQRKPTGKTHHTRYSYRGTWGMPPVEMTQDGWTYRKIESFHLDKADAD